MGIFDGIIGGLVSAGATSLINQVLEQNGGVAGLVSKFDKNGLGSIVSSWVGTGANQAINPAQIQQALGSDALAGIASKLGMSQEDIAAKLAEFLPDAVDKLAPTGQIQEAA